EKLIGQEFSLMSFCDGRHTAGMPIVQDHKRAYDGDRGPNTGGMGTYSDFNHSLPFLRDSDIEEAQSITRQVAQALFKETGAYFKGVMYGGFIAVKDGVRLIEYNALFGDPEAMNVLPIMETNFADVCEAIIRGELKGMKVEFANKATVCKYVVPEGYPDNPVKGVKIEIGSDRGGHTHDTGHADSSASGVLKTYFASVDQRDDGLYLAGSRAVAMVGIADNLAEAEKLAQAGVEYVKGPVFYRRDIGTKELIQKRVEMMSYLRR
ncbi:MAG: phosphoribosylglycinamide synthetase C domain-containing protein, partial [Patescibacteria group bacterium]